MQLAQLTWPQVEAYLKTSQTLIIPIGSTEQHGPTGLIGTDAMSATEISKRVGENLGLMVAPAINYGMALHHMDFVGSATVRPSVFIAMIKDIVEGFVKHGFKKIIFINGHGGNIAPLTTAFSECLYSDQSYSLKLINWWHLKSVQNFENETFGAENGFHATCGEVAVTKALYPEIFAKIKEENFSVTQEKTDWPLSPSQFRKSFPDGRMGSNPTKSKAEHGHKILQLAVQEISELLNS